MPFHFSPVLFHEEAPQNIVYLCKTLACILNPINPQETLLRFNSGARNLEPKAKTLNSKHEA